MLTQNQIKLIRSLQQKKFRNELHQFIAEGPKLVEELIDSRFSFDSIYALKPWLDEHAERLGSKEIPFTEITEKELERISGLTTPHSVLAVLNTPENILPGNVFGKDVVLVLDNIKDPGNLGTIIRTADWFGIDNIVCSETTVDVYNPKVIQATMGSIARVSVFYADLTSVLKDRVKNIPVYGTFMTGKPIAEFKTEENAVIVLGNESTGISEDLFPFIQHRVSVPLHRPVGKKNPESLNASVAAAIMCYEFRKK
jgi:RNA methyltransferase, TrmH family